MNYSESFEEFARSVQPMDLALYAGVGVVLWVLLKDKTTPIQTFIGNAFKTIKNNTNNLISKSNVSNIVTVKKNKDVFFDLIVSWKKTRDLAIEAGCDEAVKNIDQIFPYLNPEQCVKKNVESTNE